MLYNFNFRWYVNAHRYITVHSTMLYYEALHFSVTAAAFLPAPSESLKTHRHSERDASAMKSRVKTTYPSTRGTHFTQHNHPPSEKRNKCLKNNYAVTKQGRNRRELSTIKHNGAGSKVEKDRDKPKKTTGWRSTLAVRDAVANIWPQR